MFGNEDFSDFKGEDFHAPLLLTENNTDYAMDNELHGYDYTMWDSNIHPCFNFNCGLTKTPLKLGHGWVIAHHYRQVSNIRRIKSQHLKDYRTVLWFSVRNPLKPDVKSIMKM